MRRIVYDAALPKEVIMTVNVQAAVGYTWEILAFVWLIGLAFTKRTVRSQAPGPRLFHLAIIMLGFFLLGSRYVRAGWLGMRILPSAEWLPVAGLVVTIAGCLFAIWARLTLGSNWSGRATVKAGHELIQTGPYSLARHPIYTGLLVAAVGTAVAEGEARCILGFVLVILGFVVKIGQEERLMLDTFPKEYPAYRQRVKALIPGVF
jgi:protein-S-isoprenylcysteine O-methyltransferase Ste14